MKKVLYLTNIEAPYRVRFFNELAKYCELTVLFECRKSKTRDESWEGSEKSNYRRVYLEGIRIKNEGSFSFKILKYILGGYDIVVVGCYNSPVQLMAILTMRLLGVPYYLNIDGETFLEGTGLKTAVKRFVLKGARKYLAAGEKSGAALQKVVGKKPVIPYYFSSLDEAELQENRSIPLQPRTETVLVVGQYMDYKGLDVALKVAEMDPGRKYLFVGMGKRTELFMQTQHLERLPNVEIIPFLKKSELEAAYRRCAAMVLPSRQECWGLVINEAASFGTPIVSTWGSGAGVEFLEDRYSCYLAKPGDADDLYHRIQQLLNSAQQDEYRDYLLEKSSRYSIEKSVQAHLSAFEIER